jgi:2-oxoisovalerate dehydrogenase E1 component alpha subunit
VLAVLDAVRTGRRRAAAGDGPTMVEAVTYRMGAHTNSDDPTRYVPREVLKDWQARDPIERFRTELQRAGLWDDDRHAETAAAVEARLERIIDNALAREVDPAAALDHVTVAADARTAAQRADIVARSAPAAAPDDASAAHDDADGDTGAVSWRA